MSLRNLRGRNFGAAVGQERLKLLARPLALTQGVSFRNLDGYRDAALFRATARECFAGGLFSQCFPVPNQPLVPVETRAGFTAFTAVVVING